MSISNLLKIGPLRPFSLPDSSLYNKTLVFLVPIESYILMNRSMWLLNCFALLSISIASNGQEQLGLRLGNYSGINGTMFNPASNVSSFLKWDINIISGGAFAENNYVYISDANLFKMLKNRSGLTFAGDGQTEISANDGLVYDFTTGNRKKEEFVSGFITPPSAMFHIKDHTLGIFFNTRSVSSTNRMSRNLGYYDLDALENGDVINISPFKSAGMAWSEIGLNYGRNALKKGRHLLNVGVTAKLLQGYEAYYFSNNQNTTITVQQDFMTYQNADIFYGIASGITSTETNDYDISVRGYGMSADIGAVYIIQN